MLGSLNYGWCCVGAGVDGRACKRVGLGQREQSKSRSAQRLGAQRRGRGLVMALLRPLVEVLLVRVRVLVLGWGESRSSH
jgi:hypothetical protein